VERGASAAAVSAPAPPLQAQPVRVALAARDASPATIPLPVQLEKSTPPLSPSERADVEYRRGVELHEHARPGDAETAFAAALQHDPRHAAARRALAVEWIGRGRLGDAERILAEGLALDPQQPQLAIVTARIQADRRDLPAGIATLRASLGGSGTAPSDQAEAMALMATLQQGAGQHREAVDSFAAALRQVPQNGAWWTGLGLSLAAEGRAASAREAFERARATGTLAPELQLYVEQRLRATAP
jgi:MSHA biogenesis protein MshN